MTQLALLGLGICLTLATWEWLAKPAILDDTRDRLFDLRDEVLRNGFLSLGYDLHHPLYLNLRNLVNGHLRHTEKFSFVGYLSMMLWMKKNSDLLLALQREREGLFHSDDERLQLLAKEVRHKAAVVMLLHVVRTSLIARLTMSIVTVVVCASKCRKYLSNLSGLNFHTIPSFSKAIAFVLMTILPAHFIPGAAANATQQFVEDMALEA